MLRSNLEVRYTLQLSQMTETTDVLHIQLTSYSTYQRITCDLNTREKQLGRVRSCSLARETTCLYSLYQSAREKVTDTVREGEIDFEFASRCNGSGKKKRKGKKLA